MIHLFDNDPRAISEPEIYRYNHGSFASIHINLNKELKKLGYYSEPNNCEWCGICDGLNIGFKYKDKKSFFISVWETANTLPYYHVQTAKKTNQKLFGLSEQISKLWRKYGFQCETLYPGCDTNFWYPTKEKCKDKFIFCVTNSSNVRGALDLIISAFALAFYNRWDIELRIKDTNKNSKLIEKIDKFVKNGANIKYYTGRWTMQQMRDFYSESHCTINLQRAASFGLTTLESMSCGSLCLTGDAQPSNEIVNCEIAELIPVDKEVFLNQKARELECEWGFLNCYPNFKYPEDPKYNDFNINSVLFAMKKIYNKWDSYYSKINSRQYIVNNWQWSNSANKLIELLKY